MRHVDDGMLHAWLDGELGVYAAADVQWIREHLEDCEVCATRLEEERALRAEALDILEGDAPDLEGLPSLEELRARAAGTPTDGGQRAGGGTTGPDGGRGSGPTPVQRARRLAWAASIVLAAGAGWMANSLSERSGGMGPTPRLQSPAPLESETSRIQQNMQVVPPADAIDAEAEGADAPVSPDAAEAPFASEAPAGAATGAGAAGAEAESPEIRARRFDEDAAVPPGAFATAIDSLQRQKVGEGALVPPVSDTGITILAPLDVQVRGGQTAEVTGEARASEEASLTASAQPIRAMADLAGGLPQGAVPGLEILAVDTLPESDEIRRIRQRVDTEGVLEVYLLPASRPPETLPEPGAEVNQWVVTLEEGWRVLRGRFPVERLREWAERS